MLNVIFTHFSPQRRVCLPSWDSPSSASPTSLKYPLWFGASWVAFFHYTSMSFLYSGLCLFMMLSFCSQVLVLLGRAVNIFPLSFLLNFFRDHKITPKMMFIMWFSGEMLSWFRTDSAHLPGVAASGSKRKCQKFPNSQKIKTKCFCLTIRLNKHSNKTINTKMNHPILFKKKA